MSTYRYGPRLSKRATLAGLAAVTIGVFGIGMSIPYAVGEDPAQEAERSTTETTVRQRRRPVPVAQIVETTTSTTTARASSG